MTLPWTASFAAHLGFAPDNMRPQLLHTAGSSHVEEHVQCAKDLGFAGILYPFPLDRPANEVRALSRALDEAELSASCVLCSKVEDVVRPLWTASDTAGRRNLADQVRRAGDVAVALGSKTLVTLIASDPSEACEDRQLAQVATNLREAGSIARDLGLKLAFEPMVAVPGMLVRSVRDAVDLLREVDSSSVGLVFDTAHASMTDGDLHEALEMAGDWVAHLQIADQPGRVEPGAGFLPLADLVATALANGYSGLIDLEFDWQEPSPEGEQKGLERLRKFDGQVLAATRSHR